MIHSKDCCEDEEEELEHDEHHVDGLDVVPLPSNNVNCDIWVIDDGLGMAIEGEVECDQF